MENKLLKLPTGIQTFEKLRKENCVYVDKTKYLVDLIDKGSIYFLARPRRFGKSLTITTFDALFSGEKELFKGLKAEEFLNSPDFEPSPVIRLDMSRISTDQGLEIIKESLINLTKSIAKKLQIKLSKTKIYGDLLSELISLTAIKYNQKVVVLVDEYDKPYTDFINNKDMAEKVRNILRSYYTQLKANDEYIRFIFITGISKFTKMGVFSTLNNLADISMNPDYAEICGYTEKEIRDNFPYYLSETAKRMNINVEELIIRMRDYYNGFSFDYDAEVKIYNPFSTLRFFTEKDFANFWFDSGTPKFIADYLKTKKLTVEQFRNMPVSEEFVRNTGDVDTTTPEGFLFQSGYLTLRPGTTNQLSLDYPNTEVLNSMSNLLTQNILNEDAHYSQNLLLIALDSGDVKKLITAFNSLLANIPYDDFTRAAEIVVSLKDYTFTAREWLYRSTILAFIRGSGAIVVPESHTNLGRSDLVVIHRDKVWVIEIKVAYKNNNIQKKAEEALQQIKDKNYATPYPNAICVGLVIDDEKRLIVNC